MRKLILSVLSSAIIMTCISNGTNVKANEKEEIVDTNNLFKTVEYYDFSDVDFTKDSNGRITYEMKGLKTSSVKKFQVEKFLSDPNKRDIVEKNLENNIKTQGAATTRYYFKDNEDSEGAIEFLTNNEMQVKDKGSIGIMAETYPYNGYFDLTLSASPSSGPGVVTYWTQLRASWTYPNSANKHSAPAPSDDVMNIYPGNGFSRISKSFSGNYNSYYASAYDQYYGPISAVNIDNSADHAAWRFADQYSSTIFMKVAYAGAGFTNYSRQNRQVQFHGQYIHTYTAINASFSVSYGGGSISISGVDRQWPFTVYSNWVSI